jgi:hypothetical protein
MDEEEFKNENGEEIDEEVFELMENHELDQDEAEHVKEIMDTEGLGEEEAIELKAVIMYLSQLGIAGHGQQIIQ